MDNLSKATRIADALYAVACGVTLPVDYLEDAPGSEGVRDAVAQGYLISDGAGVLQLSETGKQVSFQKDPCGYIYTTLNILELVRKLGLEDRVIDLRLS